MRLLTPEVGWVLGGNRLLWTADAGKNWTDITPEAGPIPAFGSRARIASVFFLDTSTGWVLLYQTDPKTDEPRFKLASTSDAGVNWSIESLTIPGVDPRSTLLSGSGRIDFLDYLHGWMNLDVVSSSNFRLGILVKTEDGGRTWNSANSPSVAGPGVAGLIRFVTTEDGWLAGGPGNEHIFATHDGCKTWQEVSLKPSPQVGAAIYPAYDLPVFEDSRHGFLPVTYAGPEGTPSKLVVYSTDDRGRTWKPSKVLAMSKETPIGEVVPVAISDSILLASTEPSVSGVAFASVPLTGVAAPSVALSTVSASELSFADVRHGWALGRGGELLYTADGGATWTDVTPHG